MIETVDPQRLDLGHLALFAGYAYADAVQAELAEHGYDDVRFSHGFVFQHLVGAERSISALAERLGVSQQAASKSIAELESLGYVERVAAEADARHRLVRLTKRGHALIAASRRARAAVEKRIERRHGNTTLAQTKRVLADVLETLGGANAVRGRRVVAPR